MEHFDNPYDEEHKIKAPAKFDILDVVADIFGMSRMPDRMPPPERRDMSEAGQLRRTAFRFDQQGETANAILFRNAAYILEHPDARVDRMRE
jgi:hypothetical protein